MNNLLDKLINLLQKDERLLVDGKLLKNKVIELAYKLDSGLVKLLLSDEEIKKVFFTDIEGVLVFNQLKFQTFVSNKEFLPDSYTAYKNKIGLTSGDEFISQSKEVVLSFPYKDCVLEGGQDKDDVERNEVFYNVTLAPDQVDRLLEEKVLKNFMKFDKSGVNTVNTLNGDDNLIIKGNNLLVLNSLREKFNSSVKCIYIDPPYNTGNDSFNYNDNFNHSTWLVFMKNRLEVAKELLNDEGVIFVHCDHNEQAYLKVLMDEIFTQENYIETITVVNNPRGRDYGGVANMHEFINVYSKSLNYDLYPLIEKDKVFPYEDEKGGFEIRELRNRNIKFNDKNRPNLVYPFYLNPEREDENGFYEISLTKQANWVEVWPSRSQGIQTVWRWGKEKSEKNLNINICGKKMTENGRYQIVEKYREKSRMVRSVWWDKEVNSERGTLHLKELFNAKVFDNPKPEETLMRIIEMSTREGDLVLDYHLGSGTTCAVAHKMNRRYIGIEQMDYIENVTVQRLKKVIEGEQGGISKTVDWKGGGSFVYCELAKSNQKFIDEIEGTDDYLTILHKIVRDGFLTHKIDLNRLDESTFEQLSKNEQKALLLEILDANHLYVNLSDIDDARFAISDEDKRLNKQFYSI